MGSKTEAMYKELYSWIYMCLLSATPSISLGPELRIMMDFETAMRKPWEERWTEHKVLGCLFHFCQVSKFHQ